MGISREDREIGELVVKLCKAYKDECRKDSNTMRLVKVELRTAKLCIERALNMLGGDDGAV